MFGFFLSVVGVLFIGLCWFYASAQSNAIKAARAAYIEALVKLKSSPSSSDLKSVALNRGRYYLNLANANKGLTAYNEVALANDIAAATAGAVAAPLPVISSVTNSIETRLSTLDSLKEKSHGL